MRNMKFILPILLITLSFISCRKEPWRVWGKGDTIIEVRDISGFSGIDLGIDGEVYYQQDSIYRVEISAQSNILSAIETEVQGGILKITSRANLFHHKPIIITVYSPGMHLLTLSGSGNIYAQNGINSGSMDVSVTGSGNISVQSLTAQNLDGKISGSGNINIDGGSVSDEELLISGSGNIDALELVSNTGNIKISGSGDVMVHVLQSMIVSISGSGDVKYRGTPAIETHMSGSGNLTHVN